MKTQSKITQEQTLQEWWDNELFVSKTFNKNQIRSSIRRNKIEKIFDLKIFENSFGSL